MECLESCQPFSRWLLSQKIWILDIGHVSEYTSTRYKLLNAKLHEKCPYSEFFWFVPSRIRTQYGEIWIISPYLVRVRENKDQKNSEYGHLSRSGMFRAFCLTETESKTPKPSHFRLFRCYEPFPVKNLLWWDKILSTDTVSVLGRQKCCCVKLNILLSLISLGFQPLTYC